MGGKQKTEKEKYRGGKAERRGTETMRQQKWWGERCGNRSSGVKDVVQESSSVERERQGEGPNGPRRGDKIEGK